jgi:hypothetical protein
MNRYHLTAVLASITGIVAVLGLGVACIDRELPPPTNRKAIQLIDHLTAVSEGAVGVHETAMASGFIASDNPPEFEGGILGSKIPVNHPAMKEIVEMGVDALPDLLNHLSDDRKTRLVVGGKKVFGVNWFSNEYDPRRGQPKFDTGDAETHKYVDEYTIRVGDLCYVAIGQIVNRRLYAIRYQPTLCLVINSPVESPPLAEAVRKDWGKLTRNEHRKMLLRESREKSHRAEPALTRLRFYYPEAESGKN